MSSLISTNIWSYIATYLCYVDKMALKMVCKMTHQITINFKSIVIKKLEKHIDNPIEFCNKLYEYNTIISGSFILACLYDTNDYNDIDIFNREIEHNNISNYSLFSQYIYDMKKYKHDFRLYGQVYNIRDWFINNTSLQIISLYMDPIKYIDTTFDMDLCKSYFNGNSLVVKSWDKLFQRKDFIKPNGLLMLYYTNEINVENLSEKRMLKYNNRGFNIQLHPFYNSIKQKIMNDITNKYGESGDGFKQTDDFCIDLSIY